MTRKEIFETVLAVVCNVCETAPEDIMCGVKKTEVVEARSIAAHYLQRYGITPGDVIRFSGGSVKHRYCVTKSASMYYDRYEQSFSFRSEADEVGNALTRILQQGRNETETH